MRQNNLNDMLAAIEATADSMIVAHVLPPIMHETAGPPPTSRIMTARDLVAETGGRVGSDLLITLAEAASPLTIELDRQQLTGWLAQAGDMAADEEGEGLLMGYDPLRPDRRIAASDVTVTDDAVLVRGDAGATETLFAWSDVAALSANRDADSAMVLLADGRSVFLHADVDWDNRLS